MTILLDGVAELSLGSIMFRIGLNLVMWLHLATEETEKCRSFFLFILCVVVFFVLFF